MSKNRVKSAISDGLYITDGVSLGLHTLVRTLLHKVASYVAMIPDGHAIQDFHQTALVN